MMKSFFDKQYSTPNWLQEKLLTNKLSRRRLLKSAAGSAAAVGLVISPKVFASDSGFESKLKSELESDPWATLDAVLNHLLPSSSSGPGAKEIQATLYLYQLIHQQPTNEDEIEFIYKGVGWLNGYTESKHQQGFVELADSEKEIMLKDISRSQAGDNWLSMLMSNIYEAMLAPSAYGGNPKGVGWQWLNHQAGFPLPDKGQRYFELPKRSSTKRPVKVAVISNSELISKQTSAKKVFKA